MRPPPPPARIGYVQAAGHRIRASVRGEGPPLLLVMGLGGNLDMWQPLEGELVPRGIQTITFDLPGTGGSPVSLPPRRMRGLARIAAGVLVALGYASVDVLGVSFGGGVAQQLAYQTPHRVRRLILAATMPGLGGVPASPCVLLHLATPLRYWSPSHFHRIAPHLYGGQARRDVDQTMARSLPRFERPPSAYGYLAQLWAVAGWTSLPWLHRIRQPTLVLAGDDDPIIPLANGRILATRIPGARLTVVRGGRHLFLLDQADEAAGHIAAFLTP